jgi:hypothetical protein
MQKMYTFVSDIETREVTVFNKKEALEGKYALNKTASKL